MSDRFLAKVRVDSVSGCWHWTGCRTSQGYGRFNFEQRIQNAHRVSYLMHRGPIPEGAEVDHLCHNRGCVSPAHLEAVTPAENKRRAVHQISETCPSGHPMDGVVSSRRDGTYRICKTCRRTHDARHRAKKAAA